MVSNPVSQVKKKVRTSVTVSEDDYRDIEQIAAKKKVSVAWVVREALHQYLTREFPMFRTGKS